MKITKQMQEIQYKIDTYEKEVKRNKIIQKSACHIIMSILTLGILAIVLQCHINAYKYDIKNLKDKINILKNQQSEARVCKVQFNDVVEVLPFNHLKAPKALRSNYKPTKEAIDFTKDTRSDNKTFRKSSDARAAFKLAEEESIKRGT